VVVGGSRHVVGGALLMSQPQYCYEGCRVWWDF
jgi:hypothetical protein